jgi:chromosome segregation ATPase
MAIDVNALRKFQETWAPVMEAIPAVMDAVAKKADMDRALAAQQSELTKAKAEIQKVYDEAEKRLTAANVTIKAMLDRQAQISQAIDAARKDADEKAKVAQEAAMQRLAAVESRLAGAEAKLKTVDADIRRKTDAAMADHAAQVEAMESEIKELDKRRAAAEKALESLRAKLG